MEEVEDTIVEEREMLMIPPNNGGLPTLRKAHFLKPIFNPKIQSFPKLPSMSVSSESNITKDGIFFRGMQKTQNSWKKWVEDLQEAHHFSWKKVGIFDAIRGSTYNIKNDNDLIIGLAEKWCPETNTFMFSWGEATLTLEDVMIIGGFSVLGACVKFLPKFGDYDEIQKKLDDACAKIKRDTEMSQANHSAWMKYFEGKGGELEHVALIVLWLSRYVFCSSNVYSIAVNLVRGTRIALAPAVLASIYRDLSALKKKIETPDCERGQDGGSKLVLWAPLQLVQVWAWERFSTLAPVPVPLVRGEPRLARWHGVNRLKYRSLRQKIESNDDGDGFVWRPYAIGVKNWECPKFYCDQELWVLVDSEVDDELLSFARCLRACELVGLKGVEQYLPHRVAMQFGMDQDIPICIPKSNNSDFSFAWCMYDIPFVGLKLYVPPRLLEGDVTVQYSDWWRSQWWSLQVKVPVIVQKRRESPKKVKRLSEILNKTEAENCKKDPVCSASLCTEAVKLDGFNSVPSAENDNSVQDVVINLLLGLEGASETYEPAAAIEEVKGKEANNNGNISLENTSPSEVPQCSSSQQKEAMDLDVNGSGSDMPRNISFSDKSIEPQFIYDKTTETEPIEMVDPLIGLEGDAMEVDGKKEVNDSSKNVGESGTFYEVTCLQDDVLTGDNRMLSGTMPSIDAEMTVEGVQSNTKEDVDINKTSVDDIVVISDEEQSSPCNHFEEFLTSFETRVNRLSRIVHALKTAKNRAVGG